MRRQPSAQPGAPTFDVAQSFRSLIQLFAAGGATVDTPEPSPTERDPPPAIVARTLIQPDGDVVCMVTPAYCEDAALRSAHNQRVTDWYTTAESTMSRVVAALTMVGAAGGTLLSALDDRSQLLGPGWLTNVAVGLLLASVLSAAPRLVLRLAKVRVLRGGQ